MRLYGGMDDNELGKRLEGIDAKLDALLAVLDKYGPLLETFTGARKPSAALISRLTRN